MNIKKHIIVSILLLISIICHAQLPFEKPFKWKWKVTKKTLIISINIPKGNYLYSEKTKVKVSPKGKNTLKAEFQPEYLKYKDSFGEALIYPEGLKKWIFTIQEETEYDVNIAFQGCSKETATSPGICFMPGNEIFKVSTGQINVAVKKQEKKSRKTSIKDTEMMTLLHDFKVVNVAGGFMNTETFLAFLENNKDTEKTPDSPFAKKAIIWTILLVLIGGVALNLTPCVLPMIPVNLAIIGAGKSAQSKRTGFFRGGIYGLGIALSYGVLGLFTVLTGSQFGSLNSSPTFNFIIAIVFILLALAMLDVFTIDFSRFGGKIKTPEETEKGSLFPVFFLGIIAALLAGACVAPVVIAVILQATTMYSEGHILGLALPFLLGLGMALPWPFAGAGIASLPKPGMWMVRIKQAFAIFILLFAIYYVYLGVGLLKTDSNAIDILKKGLIEAKQKDKPVFIDFWATWCKNCKKMERTTFKDPKVIEKLHNFVEIKFQAEKIDSPEIKEIMDKYKLIGLPSYVILEKH